MYEFIRKQNIERLLRQLAQESDPERRKVIEAQLRDHQAGDPIRHKVDPGRGGGA